MSYTKFFLCLLGFCILFALGVDAETLSKEDIIKLVELQIGDEVIIAKIRKDGIDFTIDNTVLEQLQQAGASASVLQAVRKAENKKGTAITYQDILQLLNMGIDNSAIIKRVSNSPMVFTLSRQQVRELKNAGASDELLAALVQRISDSQIFTVGYTDKKAALQALQALAPDKVRDALYEAMKSQNSWVKKWAMSELRK